MIISFDIVKILDKRNQLLYFFIHLVEFLKSIFMVIIKLLLLGFFQNMELLVKLNMPWIKYSHLEH